MAENWTAEQQQAIQNRNRNLLVSAAAGSGKTAVLTARILAMVTDPEHPVDIDRILVVTFTRAAAAEMRDRIRKAIRDRADEEPGNTQLRRQLSLLSHAQITTIDSFLNSVVRSHADLIDMTAELQKFTAEMARVRDGSCGSVKMIPTFIGSYSAPAKSVCVTAIDIGGSHVRCCRMNVVPGHVPVPGDQISFPTPGIKTAVTTRCFFEEIVKNVKDHLDTDHIAICFSLATAQLQLMLSAAKSNVILP